MLSIFSGLVILILTYYKQLNRLWTGWALIKMKAKDFWVNFLFLFICLHSFPVIPLDIVLIKRLKRVGLYVSMALTLLCHFCNCLSGCKSAAKDCFHPPSSLHSPSNSCIPTCSAARSLPPSSRRQSSTPHNTTAKLSELWESLHVLCGMPCGSQVSPALTVLCGSTGEGGVMRCVCERVQVCV